MSTGRSPKRTRMFAWLYKREDPRADVFNSPARGLRTISIWLTPACTKGRTIFFTLSERPLTTLWLNVVGAVVLSQFGAVLVAPPGGRPGPTGLTQLSIGLVNATQLVSLANGARPAAMARSQALATLGAYTLPL